MIEFLAILFAPILGGMIYGVERVIKARMQNRIGPSVWQPFYDMFKLFNKQTLVLHPFHSLMAILYFFILWYTVAYMIMGGNFLYVVFLHLLATIIFIIAGFSVKSVYSHIGSNRELLTMLAYEPVFIFMAVGFYMVYGSFDIDIIRHSDSGFLKLFLIFLAFLFIIPIKLKKSPFDATMAHQEIVGGAEVEYSGLFYEFLYTARWLEYIFIYMVLTFFTGDNYILMVMLLFSVFLGVNLVDNSTARLNISTMIKLSLSIALVLCLINILGLSYAL